MLSDYYFNLIKYASEQVILICDFFQTSFQKCNEFWLNFHEVYIFILLKYYLIECLSFFGRKNNYFTVLNFFQIFQEIFFGSNFCNKIKIDPMNLCSPTDSPVWHPYTGWKNFCQQVVSRTPAHHSRLGSGTSHPSLAGAPFSFRQKKYFSKKTTHL